MLTWRKVQSVVRGWAILNMVSGAEDVPRVDCCEHGEWCSVLSKSGLLFKW